MELDLELVRLQEVKVWRVKMHIVVEECVLHFKGGKLQFSVEFQK
jgi:hypothetical protein